jgi:hypothetical protein
LIGADLVNINMIYCLGLFTVLSNSLLLVIEELDELKFGKVKDKGRLPSWILQSSELD